MKRALNGTGDQACGPGGRRACTGGVRPWRRGLTAAALVSLIAVGGLVGCQKPVKRRQTPPVQLTDIQGYLEFVARQREQEQQSKTSRGGDRVSEETIFEENLELDVEGYAYHPNLLEFTAAGLFGLIQQSYQENTPSLTRRGGRDGTTLGFDLTGDFLQKKKYPGTVYARRLRSTEPRAFASSIETTTTSYGLLWQYLSPKVPTSFRLSRNDTLLEPLDTEEEDGGQTDTNYRFETGYVFNKFNILSLTYNHDSTSERRFALDYETDEVELDHVVDFGHEHQHRLESELSYFNQKGSFDIERTRWRQNLRLQHSDTLRSWYRLDALDRKHGSLTGIPPIEERSYRLSGTVEHRLYDSLVSQFGAFGQIQSFESGAEIERYGINASFEYSKKNRWGMFRAGYSARFEREDRAGGSVSAEVRDESYTFQDPDPITLQGRNIDSGSIVITAGDGFTFYQLGSDYTLRTLGGRIEIERVPTGRIADGEAVLIDYIFDTGGIFTLDTANQALLVRQDFSFGLSPYYRLRWQHQSITPRAAEGVFLEDIRAHAVGLEYRWRSLDLGLEYEDYGSTIDPFEAVRLRASYSHHFRIGATASIGTSWSNVTHRGLQQRESTFFTMHGRYRHSITRNLVVEGTLLYRDSDDSIRGDDQGLDADFSLVWSLRQTEIRITYEYGRFEDRFAQSNASTFYFQLRRRF